MSKLTDFMKGMIIGVCIGVIIVSIPAALINRHRKSKELIEYAQRQQTIETMREDYSNRDPYEFFDTVPGVRGAADGALADFKRKRDEVLQRFRDRFTDK